MTAASPGSLIVPLTTGHRQWADPVVQWFKPITVDGSTGTPLYDGSVLTALSDALSLPLKSRPTIALEANDIVRIAEHALVTFDAAYRPVVLVTEWSAPQSADSPVAEAPIRGGIIEIVAKVDPSGERVRVVFGSWHTAMRDRGRDLGLVWHSQKRRFEDGTSTAIGWLSGALTADVQEWLAAARLSADTAPATPAA